MSYLAAVQILVVDDNAHMRTIVSSILKAAGVKSVLEAVDGRAGFNALQKFPIDLVIVDFTMSPVDGVEFTKLVRMSPQSANPLLPIIMMTGHSAMNRVHKARDAGVTEFVAKPISPKTILDRVHAVIWNPRNFIRLESYFGPDRRRNKREIYNGPLRRSEDYQEDIAAN